MLTAARPPIGSTSEKGQKRCQTPRATAGTRRPARDLSCAQKRGHTIGKRCASVAEACGKVQARRRAAQLGSGQTGRERGQREGAARGTRRASGASSVPVRADVGGRAPSAEVCAVSGAKSSSLSIGPVPPTTSLRVADGDFAGTSRGRRARWVGRSARLKFRTASGSSLSTW